MPDIGVVEILIALFLFLPLCRPYIKSFVPVDGLVWLPPIALFCVAAIFPAYGFRPESIPLGIYTLIFNLFNLRLLIASITKLRYAEDAERSFVYFSLMLVFLAAVEIIALRFIPPIETDTLANAQNVIVRDDSMNHEYFIRVYNTNSVPAPKPLIIVIPPVLGSVLIVDTTCDALAARGATVLSFSRKGFDIPAVNGEGRIVLPNISLLRKSFLALSGGTKRERQNHEGRFFETERMYDIEFILPFAITNYMPSSVSIAAYGAGGGALLLLENNESLAQFDIESALIIESRLYSMFESAHRDDSTDAQYNANAAIRILRDVQRWFSKRANKTVVPLPVLNAPRYPLSVLTSDAFNTPDVNEGGYRGLALFLKRNPAVAHTAERGAGPADFCDAPVKYPFVTALAHGNAPRELSGEAAVFKAASLIAGFLEGGRASGNR